MFLAKLLINLIKFKTGLREWERRVGVHLAFGI